MRLHSKLRSFTQILLILSPRDKTKLFMTTLNKIKLCKRDIFLTKKSYLEKINCVFWSKIVVRLLSSGIIINATESVALIIIPLQSKQISEAKYAK